MNYWIIPTLLLALILFGITFLLNSVARLLVRAVTRGYAKAST